jgi:hypothetical protein
MVTATALPPDRNKVAPTLTSNGPETLSEFRIWHPYEGTPQPPLSPIVLKDACRASIKRLDTILPRPANEGRRHEGSRSAWQRRALARSWISTLEACPLAEIFNIGARDPSARTTAQKFKRFMAYAKAKMSRMARPTEAVLRRRDIIPSSFQRLLPKCYVTSGAKNRWFLYQSAVVASFLRFRGRASIRSRSWRRSAGTLSHRSGIARRMAAPKGLRFNPSTGFQR